MEEKRPTIYQRLLARKFVREGFSVGELDCDGRLPYFAGVKLVGKIGNGGFSILNGFSERYPVLQNVLDHYSVELGVLLKDFQKAPMLQGLDSENLEMYRSLAEFDGAVLAMAIQGDQLLTVTWVRNPHNGSLIWGHYFMEDFQRAKKDFAIRAGLVNEEELFSKEELRTIRDLANEALDSEDITISEDDLLELGRHAANLLPEEADQGESPTMQM